MKILRERPPIFDRIVEVIGRPPVGAIYTWGDTIYAPAGAELPPDLIEHERAHSQQQAAMGGPEVWWERYLSDRAFRLEVEVEAYRAQYQFALRAGLGHEMRRQMARTLAKHLSGPMYGHIVRRERALQLIKA